MSKRNLYNKILNLFFEEDNRNEEERIKEEATDRFYIRLIKSSFIINAVIMIYLFFKGKFEFFDTGTLVDFTLLIGIGIGVLYFDLASKKGR